MNLSDPIRHLLCAPDASIAAAAAAAAAPAPTAIMHLAASGSSAAAAVPLTLPLLPALNLTTITAKEISRLIGNLPCLIAHVALVVISVIYMMGAEDFFKWQFVIAVSLACWSSLLCLPAPQDAIALYIKNSFVVDKVLLPLGIVTDDLVRQINHHLDIYYYPEFAWKLALWSYLVLKLGTFGHCLAAAGYRAKRYERAQEVYEDTIWISKWVAIYNLACIPACVFSLLKHPWDLRPLSIFMVMWYADDCVNEVEPARRVKREKSLVPGGESTGRRLYWRREITGIWLAWDRYRAVDEEGERDWLYFMLTWAVIAAWFVYILE